MRLAYLLLPKFLLFVFALTIGLCSFQADTFAQQTPKQLAEQFEQKGEQILQNTPKQKCQAATNFDKAAEKYLEASESKFIALDRQWEYMKKALENLRKAANLYKHQDCGDNHRAKQANERATQLEHQLFQFETAHAHSLPLPKTDKSHLPPVNPVPPPPEPKEEKAKVETEKPKTPKAQGRTSRGGRGGNRGGKDNVKPPASQKPECDKDDKPKRKVIFKQVYQVPHPELEVKIETEDATGRGEYGKGVAIMGDFFGGMGDVLKAGKKIVQAVPGGGLVAGVPMSYFQLLMEGASSIVNQAKAIQKGNKYTLVNLSIEVPYKEYRLTCVEIYKCQNGKWVLTDTKMKNVETKKSKEGKTKKIFDDVKLMDSITADKAASLVAEIVPREVKLLMENQKKYEAKLKAGCQ